MAGMLQKNALTLGFAILLVTALLLPCSTPAAGVSLESQQALERIRTWLDQGQLARARQELELWLTTPYSLASLPFLQLLAALYQRDNDAVREAATHHDILQLAPTDRTALRGRVFASERMGAPHLAAALAAQTPEIFSTTEMRHLQQAVAGKTIQWGAAESAVGLGPQRFRTTERGLARNATVIGDDPAGQQASFDRIVALRDRWRMDEALALYHTLKQRQVDMPPYTLAAAADAYLYNRQPQQARDLYLQALARSRNDPAYPERTWQFGLFEAYLESRAFQDAEQLIGELQREIPAILHKGLPGVELDNDLYARAQIGAARLRLATNALDDSQHLLEQLRQAAPFHLDVRLTYGDLLQARQQPRAAQQQYRSVLVDDPSHLYAAAGIAETALELADFGTALTQMRTLQANYPENRTVQRLQRQLEASTRPRFTLSAEGGSSTAGAGNTGNSDWQVEALFLSGVWADHWRMFVHVFSAQASFDTEDARRLRLGVGGEYLGPEWQLAAEISHADQELGAVGGSLQATWSPSDHWQLQAAFDSQSNAIPLRASDADITARTLNVHAVYTHNESRRWRTSLEQLWFSDGNERTRLSTRWEERWVHRPRYTLDTWVSFETSMNSRRDAEYFNPRHDYAMEVTLLTEWWLWRRYEREFKHRLLLGAGPYWQQGFGTGAAWTVRYEQEWNLASWRSLRYGVGYRQQPYDGIDDKRLFFFLEMAWHF